MAGGGYGRGSGWGSLSDRTAAAAATPATPDPPEHLKHCWVSDRHGRLPGLLLGWRQTGDGWSGRVVRAVPDEEGAGWVLVEEWLPAAFLEPLLS